MLFVLLFGVASVSASEDVDDSVGATDEYAVVDASDSGNNTIAQSDSRGENEGYSSPNSDDVLSAADGTFKDLYNQVKNGGTITLDRNYVYTSSSDSAYVDGITLDKTITINGNGYTLNGNNAARIFQITASGVVLNNIIFKNGKSAQGGAIYWSGSSGTVNGCTFSSNVASSTTNLQGGGAIHWEGNSANIINCKFDGNAAMNGGGLWIGGSENKIYNSVFTNHQVNSGDYSGGAIYTHTTSSKTSILNTNFTANKATGSTGGDGAALALRGSNDLVDNCIFESNQAQNDGGTIITTGAYIIIKNSKFNNNKILHSGSGTIGLWTGSSYCVVENCVFTNNHASNGGGINVQASNSNITSCIFINNSATNNGGAVYWPATGGYMEGCTFTENSATTGGAISWTGSNGNLDNNAFNDNEATSGSAIYWSGTGGTITHAGFSDYTGNEITTTSGSATVSNIDYTPLYVSVNGNGDGRTRNTPTTWANAINKIALGGTIYFLTGSYTLSSQTISKSCSLVALGDVTINANNNGRIFTIDADNVLIKGIKFINGKSDLGGAIKWNGDYGTVDSCTFSSNTATSTSDQYGGGAISYTGNYASIINSNFSENTAMNGGGIWIKGSYNEITGCVFSNNEVTSPNYSGGGLYTFYSGTSHNTISNSKFLYNKATVTSGNGGDGAAIGSRGTYDTIINCTFIGNIAANDGGTIITTGSYFTIKDSLFENNSIIGTGYGTLALWGGVNATVSNCTFTNNNASYAGAIAVRHTSGTEISGCNFVNNSAIDGGAVIITATDAKIENSNFTNNKASGNGGAIYSASTNTKISNSEFKENSAKGNGGAINAISDNMEISNCDFSGNTATNGDSISSTKEINITGSEIENQLTMAVTGNDVGSTATLTGTFANGAPATVDVYVDGTKKGSSNVKDKTFTYQITGLGVGEHIISLKDSNGNTYEFDEKLIETASTIYVTTTEKSGATGLTASSPVLWSKAIKYINSGGKIIFAAGSYSDVINRPNFMIYWRCF